jgi:hypothetical protein
VADEVDRAQVLEETQREMAIRAARGEIAEGVAGECEYCEKESPRLVGGACARCRDKFRLA